MNLFNLVALTPDTPKIENLGQNLLGSPTAEESGAFEDSLRQFVSAEKRGKEPLPQSALKASSHPKVSEKEVHESATRAQQNNVDSRDEGEEAVDKDRPRLLANPSPFLIRPKSGIDFVDAEQAPASQLSKVREALPSSRSMLGEESAASAPAVPERNTRVLPDSREVLSAHADHDSKGFTEVPDEDAPLVSSAPLGLNRHSGGEINPRPQKEVELPEAQMRPVDRTATVVAKRPIQDGLTVDERKEVPPVVAVQGGKAVMPFPEIDSSGQDLLSEPSPASDEVLVTRDVKSSYGRLNGEGSASHRPTDLVENLIATHSDTASALTEESNALPQGSVAPAQELSSAIAEIEISDVEHFADVQSADEEPSSVSLEGADRESLPVARDSSTEEANTIVAQELNVLGSEEGLSAVSDPSNSRKSISPIDDGEVFVDDAASDAEHRGFINVSDRSSELPDGAVVVRENVGSDLEAKSAFGGASEANQEPDPLARPEPEVATASTIPATNLVGSDLESEVVQHPVLENEPIAGPAPVANPARRETSEASPEWPSESQEETVVPVVGTESAEDVLKEPKLPDSDIGDVVPAGQPQVVDDELPELDLSQQNDASAAVGGPVPVVATQFEADGRTKEPLAENLTPRKDQGIALDAPRSGEPQKEPRVAVKRDIVAPQSQTRESDTPTLRAIPFSSGTAERQKSVTPSSESNAQPVRTRSEVTRNMTEAIPLSRDDTTRQSKPDQSRDMARSRPTDATPLRGQSASALSNGVGSRDAVDEPAPTVRSAPNSANASKVESPRAVEEAPVAPTVTKDKVAVRREAVGRSIGAERSAPADNASSLAQGNPSVTVSGERIQGLREHGARQDQGASAQARRDGPAVMPGQGTAQPVEVPNTSTNSGMTTTASSDPSQSAAIQSGRAIASDMGQSKGGNEQREDKKKSKRDQVAEASFVNRSGGNGMSQSTMRVAGPEAASPLIMQRVIDSIDQMVKAVHQNNVRISVDLDNGDQVQVALRISKNSVKTIFHTDSEALRIAIREGWDQLSKQMANRGLDADLPDFNSGGSGDAWQEDRSASEFEEGFREQIAEKGGRGAASSQTVDENASTTALSSEEPASGDDSKFRRYA